MSTASDAGSKVKTECLFIKVTDMSAKSLMEISKGSEGSSDDGLNLQGGVMGGGKNLWGLLGLSGRDIELKFT